MNPEPTVPIWKAKLSAAKIVHFGGQLVAVDLAMRDLRSGRCDMAIAGGVHASTPPVIMIIFS
jgi:hypothetical protein